MYVMPFKCRIMFGNIQPFCRARYPEVFCVVMSGGVWTRDTSGLTKLFDDELHKVRADVRRGKGAAVRRVANMAGANMEGRKDVVKSQSRTEHSPGHWRIVHSSHHLMRSR